MLQHTQEVVVWKECLAFAARPSAGEWIHIRICVASLSPEQLTISQYLEFKERIVGEVHSSIKPRHSMFFFTTGVTGFAMMI